MGSCVSKQSKQVRSSDPTLKCVIEKKDDFPVLRKESEDVAYQRNTLNYGGNSEDEKPKYHQDNESEASEKDAAQDTDNEEDTKNQSDKEDNSTNEQDEKAQTDNEDSAVEDEEDNNEDCKEDDKEGEEAEENQENGDENSNGDDHDSNKDNNSNKEDDDDNDDGSVNGYNSGDEDASSVDSGDEVLAKLKDKGIQRDIIMGFVDIQVPSQVHLVRIFTSSTFTDTSVERNTLMEKVYPKLKEYCQSVGYDFQVVDMRWGVRDEATDDHMTSELCMREIKACQTLSTGPNFVTFLGQKYGYRPFPTRIEATEFEKILTVIENQTDKRLLLTWFKKDDNCLPSTYVLSSIRSILPHHNNEESTAEERKRASTEWWEAFERMQIVLKTSATKAIEEESQKRKYFISVTEDEISRGILSAHNVKKHCLWFKRTIADLKEKISKPKARLFIDKVKDSIDNEAHDLLHNLSHERMLKALPRNNIKEYNVNWAGENGVSTKESDDHQKYIDQLCTDFYDDLSKMIDEGIKERKLKDLDDPLIREISQHTTNCQEKTRIFRGHDDILKKIANYVDGTSSKPLVVYGTSGCGKTTLMAMAAKQAKERHPKAGVILRFLGTTSESSTIGKALSSVCSQLVRIRGVRSHVPNQFKKLYEFFGEQLRKIESKIIIFLDSLDQLSAEDAAHTMHWLPKEFSPTVKIVVSTLPEDQYHVFPYLKTRIPFDDETYIKVPEIPDSTAVEILEAWLTDCNRTLTTSQKQLVFDTFRKTPLPLFLKLSFDEAVRWKSYTSQSEIVLQETIKAAINMLFQRIERLHGKELVSHALGFITASKNGLSDAEIDDLLSLDDIVLNDVYQYWTPPVRRVPPLLWVRARSDLGSYIVSRGADGVLVNQWYHRQFTETARERYLGPDIKKTLHKILTEYFLGTWSDHKKKPFVSKSGQEDEKERIVPAQPNIFSKEGSDDTVFNLRRLNELPRHLIQSGELELLKSEIIFNFDFLLSKLRGTNLRSVVEDLNEAMEAYPGDRDIKLIRDCVQMSARALYNDPYQLGAQMVARLCDYQNNISIKNLMEQIKDSKIPCLYPSLSCFDKPGGPLVHSLAGHTGSITSACLSKDGSMAASVSQDNTLKIWDMNTGNMLKSIDKTSGPTQLYFSVDSKYLIVAGYSGVEMIEIATEEVLFEESNILGQYGLTIALSGDGCHLAHAGGDKITVFEIKGKEMVIQKTYEEKTEQNTTGFFDFITAGGNFFAYSRGVQSKLYVRKFDNADYKKTLTPPKALLGAAFVPSGKELAALVSGSKMTDPSKEVRLVVWDTRTWDIVQDRKSAYDHMIIQVQSLSVAELPTGLEIIWPAMFQILFWNLNTGKERITMRSGYQGNQYKEAQVADGQHMLITSMDVNMHALQVYDLEALEYDEGGNKHLSALEKAQEYVGKGERDLMISEDRCGIAISIPPADPILTVWDIASHSRKAKITFEGCYPSAVFCINAEKALLMDYQSRKAFIVNIKEGTMGAIIEGYTSDTAPTLYLNTWEHLGNLHFLIMDRTQTKLELWDMNTGKLMKTIKTGWKQKIGNMWVSKNKSMMVLCKQDHDRKLKEVPFLFYNLQNNTKVSYEEKGITLDLRPENRHLAADGKLFLSVSDSSDSIKVIDTKTAEVLRTLSYTGKVLGDKIESAMIMYIEMSNSSGIVFASVNCSIQVRRSYENLYRLLAWDVMTGDVLASVNAGYMNKMMISDNDERLFNTTQSVNDQAKAAQLWDISQVRQGKISLVGNFLPETDLRFAYLAPDGQRACLGIANIDAVVFIVPCGTKGIEKRKTKVIEHKIKPNLKPFDDKK